MKIGVFDSGIGGLTVYRELSNNLPGAHIHYIGDTARVPYGTKSARTVTHFALQISWYLAARKMDAIVAACNTASAYAIDVLKEAISVPVFGVVEPGARAAARATKNGRIGVVGTRGTIGSGAYQKAITDEAPDAQVTALPCPLFVPMVEEGWLMDPITQEVAIRYLEPLMEEGVDTLVLGCTHYPLLKELISKIMGEEVTLIDSAEETAHEVRSSLLEQGLTDDEHEDEDIFEVTDSPKRFAEVGKIFLCRDIENIHHITISEHDD
jgi:glutamate racemase